MNNTGPLRFPVCIIIAATVFGFAANSPAQNRQDDITLETIGKENPFEMVTPKKNVIQRLRSSSRQPEPEEVFIEEIPELYIETVMLKFLQASSLQPVVASLSSNYGKTSIDPGTNSIIIADTEEALKRIIAQIRKADRTPQQIMIEVVIADVQLDDETEIGVNWAHVTGRGDSESFTQSLVETIADGADGMDFSFLHDGINVTIHALQQVRDVEILASPKIMVLSGQEAMIQTIQEIPYTELSDTSAGGSMTSTEFREVGVTLKVLATLTDDGKIKIDIEPEQSVNTGTFGGAQTVPIIDTRKAKTTLLMDEGQAVVLGGLRSREKRNTVDKIPLLGDIPLIGFLFANDTVDIEYSELVLFLSPHIYKGEPLTKEQIKRFNELKNSPPLEFKEHTRPEYEIMKGLFAPITGK